MIPPPPPSDSAPWLVSMAFKGCQSAVVDVVDKMMLTTYLVGDNFWVFIEKLKSWWPASILGPIENWKTRTAPDQDHQKFEISDPFGPVGPSISRSVDRWWLVCSQIEDVGGQTANSISNISNLSPIFFFAHDRPLLHHRILLISLELPIWNNRLFDAEVNIS